MTDLLRSVLDPTIPWSRVRSMRDAGYALTINLVQLVIVLLALRALLHILERVM